VEVPVADGNGIAVSHRSPFSEVEVEPEKANVPRNPQLFKDNPVFNTAEELAYFASEDRLHNSLEPNLGIIHEKPEHRAMVYMKAQGLSNNEVAEKTGYSVSWVSQICRQPWFRKQLIKELKNAGVDAVRKCIQAAALDSVFTLIDLRDDIKAPAAVRSRNADSLLDRYLGKATQHLEHSLPSTPSSEEMHELDHQISVLEKALANSEPVTP
jgi:transcriptional regulator with XRE-family HTH domain